MARVLASYGLKPCHRSVRDFSSFHSERWTTGTASLVEQQIGPPPPLSGAHHLPQSWREIEA